MKKLIIAFLSTILLLNTVQAKEKTDAVPITGVIEKVSVATLENTSNESPKKRKATKKAKKNHKTKKVSNNN